MAESATLGEKSKPISRSMRDYRNQWMSAPLCSVSLTNAPFDNTYNPSWGNHTNSSWEPKPPQFAPPASPYYASTPQPPQPPQLTSSVEQAILNLGKLVDNFIEEQRTVTVQANQETDIVESSLNKELDVFQSKIDQEFDILQQSISHQEEENLEEECLTETILGEQAQLQLQEELKEKPTEAPKELQDALESCVVYGPWRREEEILPLLTKEAVEEHQDHNLPLSPIDSMYILPTPAAHSNPETPTTKATPSALPVLQNIKKLVATVRAFATTSKTLAAAHTAWHSGWFGYWFGFGAPEPRHF